MSQRQPAGFSLIELIIVIAILGILAAFGYPAFRSWTQNAAYREQAADLATDFRRLRDVAVTNGSPQSSSLTMGPRSISGSAEKLVLKHGAACDQTSNLSLTFAPDGSVSSAATVCVLDASGAVRFRVEIASATTGRVVVSN